MILYLAGLKAIDPALREAAAIDGAGEWHAFRTVVFPALRPINIVIIVVTVIEALRAFDIVYIVNKGRNGLELLSILVDEQHRRRGQPDRLRLGDRGDPDRDLDRPDRRLRLEQLPGDRAGVTSLAATEDTRPVRKRPLTVSRVVLHAFLIVTALVWLAPVAVGALHLAAPVRGHRQERLRLAAEHAQPRQLPRTRGTRATCRCTSGTR